MTIASQRLAKHTFPCQRIDSVIDELFEVVVSIRFASEVNSRVEAGSNTSTVALRDVGGDEKRSLESEIIKYGRESHGTRT
jgi:hypothetical protein